MLFFLQKFLSYNLYIPLCTNVEKTYCYYVTWDLEVCWTCVCDCFYELCLEPILHFCESFTMYLGTKRYNKDGNEENN